MATTVTTAMCTSFKRDLMKAVHNFSASGGNTFKFALINPAGTGTYNANTTAVGTPGSGSPTTSNLGTDEVANGSGYVTGGFTLTNVDPTVDNANGTGYTTFSANPSWSSASFSANGGIIYNANAASNASVSVHSFGGTQTVASGTFTVVLPSSTSTTAILRLG